MAGVMHHNLEGARLSSILMLTDPVEHSAEETPWLPLCTTYSEREPRQPSVQEGCHQGCMVSSKHLDGQSC